MKCDELKSLWVYSRDINENCDEEFVNFAKENGYEELVEKKEVTEAIAELKAKLEDVQASHYAESVDAGMRERRLKRALWIARAQRANEHYHRYHCKFLCPLEDIPEYVKWKQVERKCRAKAEEYK